MIALAVAVATLLAAAAPESAPPAAGTAFRLALRGDLDEAAAEADRVLAAAPEDSLALTVLACVALEKGDVTTASRHAAEVEEAGSPRGPVLRRLAERRRARPSEPMRIALAEAWKAAGRPDLGWEPRLEYQELLPPLLATARAKLSGPERAALAGVPSPLGLWEDAQVVAHRERALTAADAPERNAFWVNVLLLRELSPRASDTPRQAVRAADAERRLAAALAAADPGNGYYAVVAVVAGVVAHTEDLRNIAPPFSDAELAALESAVRAPRFEWPRTRSRAESVARLREVDPVHGELRANLIAGYRVPLYSVPLMARAEATTAPGAKERAASALAAVGRRLRASPHRIDVLIGLGLEGKAAELSGDARARAALLEADEPERGISRRLQAALERVGHWPLVSTLREQVADDETAWVKALID